MAKVKAKKERKVKCPKCGEYNEKIVTILYNKRYYCEACFEATKNAVKQETDDYKILISYVCSIYNITIPDGLMFKQIKEFKDTFGYSYKGMKTTLHYFYEILEGNDTGNSRGLGIIPYVYKDAVDFYKTKKSIKDSLTKVDMDELNNDIKIITINKKSIKQKVEEDYKRLVYIDIEEL